ncbi:MAG: M48 family metallopeptidase [Alphaproteobacteria bacterium]|nr:M48 family metallopeptidase [Alphaproteobacteria bacterium]
MTQYASVGLKQHIWKNNTRSVMLLCGFPLLIFMTCYLTLALSTFWIQTEFGNADAGVIFSQSFYKILQYSPHIVGFCGVWFLIAYRLNTRIVNKMANADLVGRDKYPKLYNMLENLCISRGLPMPWLAVIESDALNAFASGINRNTYTVTVTTGLMDALDDDEMEGVLAHELTHIMNGDVRLLIISIVFVGIFSIVLEYVSMFHRNRRYRTRSSSNKKGKGNQLVIFMIVAYIVLQFASLLALVIRFSLSRKREYLADAGAVELTKNPAALASALEKISGKSKIDHLPDELDAMCIEHPPYMKGLNSGLFSVFATHPPIERRIRILKGMV